MMKVQQKISGCFRSKDGATCFATIRSYIDTMRKNGFSIIDAIGKAIEGKPIMPFSQIHAYAYPQSGQGELLQKYDAIAIKITAVEIRKHQHQFKDFDFIKFIKDGFSVYKICKIDEEEIFQGMVAVKSSTGFLECGNMEINDFNKKPHQHLQSCRQMYHCTLLQNIKR